jgi:putative phosphoesterase
MPEPPVLATIGLISDTHYQERLFALPESLAQVWGPVDLVLHAGDVGDLSVLDQLGQIAPTLAVHGNDEPEAAVRHLPEKQLLMVGGVRVLLWHSHYPDPVLERANRAGRWGPKLDRFAANAREAGAAILIYGHTHVPAINHHGGVTLFNPGALASGSFFTRQVRPMVGRLRVMAAGAFEAEHLDLATGQVMAMPAPDPLDDFALLGDRYYDWIVEPELVPLVPELRRIPYEDGRAVAQAFIHLYRRCSDAGLILRQDMIEAIKNSDEVRLSDRERLLAVLERRQDA